MRTRATVIPAMISDLRTFLSLSSQIHDVNEVKREGTRERSAFISIIR